MYGHGFYFPRRGLFQILILRVLYENPAHGYQIMNEIQRITSEKYRPEPGAIYTTLRRMEARELLVSEWERKDSGADRRIYRPTTLGIGVLKEGLRMIKGSLGLMEDLIRFYDRHFEKNE
ncbi:MAG: PadR family transcriptional regulator [Promethearchaeota archaeon]